MEERLINWLDELEQMVNDRFKAVSYDVNYKTTDEDTLAYVDAAFQKVGAIYVLLKVISKENPANCLTVAQKVFQKVKPIIELLPDTIFLTMQIFAEIGAYLEEIKEMTAHGMNDCAVAYVNYHCQKDTESPENIKYYMESFELLEETLKLFDDIDEFVFEETKRTKNALKTNLEGMKSEANYHLQQNLISNIL